MGFLGGLNTHTFDDKGRVSIPTKYRDKLCGAGDDRVVVTRFVLRGDRCLDVYPYSDWLKLEEKFRELSMFNERIADFRSFYFAAACDSAVDKQGRIHVPAELRDYAHIQKEVMFVNDNSRFRLWDPETWKRNDDAYQARISAPGGLTEVLHELKDLQV